MKTEYTIAASMEQVGAWIDADKKIEYLGILTGTWKPADNCGEFSPQVKYRIAIEPFVPEVGEEIYVWGLDESQAKIRRFISFYKQFVVVVEHNMRPECYTGYKPIPPEKPVAREGWVNPLDVYEERAILHFIRVREVTKDE